MSNWHLGDWPLYNNQTAPNVIVTNVGLQLCRQNETSLVCQECWMQLLERTLMIVLGVGRSASQNMTKYPQESIKDFKTWLCVWQSRCVFSWRNTRDGSTCTHNTRCLHGFVPSARNVYFSTGALKSWVNNTFPWIFSLKFPTAEGPTARTTNRVSSNVILFNILACKEHYHDSAVLCFRLYTKIWYKSLIY